MGDIMYSVDRIEEDIVVLENRNTKEIINVDKSILPNNLKEGTILDYINGKYIINEDYTKEIKKDIRNKFDRLKRE